MSQPLPVFGSRFTEADLISEMLSIKARAILETDLPMEVVSCGVPFLFVPLKSLEDVRRIRFNREVWERVLQNFETQNVFVFTQETEEAGSSVHCRMFAPALGISEDPATGGANGPLGCYLVRHKIIKPDEQGEVNCISEQGFEIGRPSFLTINIKVDGDSITGVRVGGQCHFMGGGYLELTQ
jgi:trans-2,3-dihydro-3-hydroxyanthranilate isomerase